MYDLQPSFRRPSRRSFLLATATACAWLGPLPRVSAQESPGEPFDFDTLSARAADIAANPYVAPEPSGGLLERLTYDLYRQIAFDPEAARWQDSGSKFRLHAFHMGWLFEVPVRLFEVADGAARPMVFTTDDFQYRHQAAGVLPEHAELPGVAGFRLH